MPRAPLHTRGSRNSGSVMAQLRVAFGCCLRDMALTSVRSLAGFRVLFAQLPFAGFGRRPKLRVASCSASAVSASHATQDPKFVPRSDWPAASRRGTEKAPNFKNAFFREAYINPKPFRIREPKEAKRGSQLRPDQAEGDLLASLKEHPGSRTSVGGPPALV